jgi:16S rRNA (uracil1498-N3)-methyltransferase
MPHLEVFYTPPDLIDKSTGSLRIVDVEAHHISHVLRHKPGDEVWVVDGVGHGYWARLTEFSKESVAGEIRDEKIGWGELKVPVGLIIPALKGARMETVIEKGTELGARWFLIPQTRHAVAKPTPEKLKRWRRIAMSAMKQCGRSYLPTIQSFTDLNSALDACQTLAGTLEEKQSPYGIVFAEMGAPQLLDNVLVRKKIGSGAWRSIFVAVGPEGGFSEEEVKKLREEGAIAFSLGTRRLRSDTAAIASLAQVISIIN